MCIFKFIIGAAIIIGGIILEVSWLAICFGTLIIGIVLLIFAPEILLLPFSFGLAIGSAFIASCK